MPQLCRDNSHKHPRTRGMFLARSHDRATACDLAELTGVCRSPRVPGLRAALLRRCKVAGTRNVFQAPETWLICHCDIPQSRCSHVSIAQRASLQRCKLERRLRRSYGRRPVTAVNAIRHLPVPSVGAKTPLTLGEAPGGDPRRICDMSMCLDSRSTQHDRHA